MAATREVGNQWQKHNFRVKVEEYDNYFALICKFIEIWILFCLEDCIFALNNIVLSFMEKNINRIKVVLAEKNLPNKWLVEQLGVSPTTVSKWVTNTSQPAMETFMKIALLLKVDINELLRFKELEGNKEK